MRFQMVEAPGGSQTLRAGDRLSLGEAMILFAGAAVGLGLLPLGAASHLPVFGPNGVSPHGLVIALYGTLSGVTMAALILMVIDRLRARRLWGPAAVSLFVAGLTAWFFLPMVAVSWIQASGSFRPLSLLLRIHLAHNSESHAHEAFYPFWPVACLALFLGCSLSGQTRKWWALESWWAEWLGMWVLAAWALPAIPIMAALVRIYIR